MTLVIGDAIAVTLSILKGFKNQDFYLFRPGGSLGKKLSSEDKKSS
jgi:arabinose-5-phosphate isomerase